MRIIVSMWFLSVCYPQTEINSNITSNTTWTLSGSPYNITSNIQLYHYVTLDIEPGVIIEGGGYVVDNFGALNAVGNEQNIILINNLHLKPGDNESSGPYFYFNLQFCKIIDGSIYFPVGSIYGSISIKDSELIDLPYIYLWYPIANCYFERNIFIDVGEIQVGSYNTTYIKNNVFYKSGGINNWNQGSNMVILYNTFLDIDRIVLELKPGYSNTNFEAINNYWNTTDESIIQSMIYDYNDDASCDGTISYIPYLTTPHSDTPEPIFGCATTTACNYNQNVQIDDGSCEYCSCQTCSGHGTCVDGGANYTCTCNSFYTGTNCETDIDECVTDNGGCGVATYYSCTNNTGAAATCTDIDECATDNGGCGDATCVNNVGADPTCSELSLFNGLIPEDFSIHSIYPNPFNPITNITYGIPEYTNVQIIIFDLAGKQVAILINELQTPGYHSVDWNANNHPSGVYFVTMRAGEYVNTQKLMLIK